MLLLFQILNVISASLNCNNIVTTAQNSQCYKTGGIVQFEFPISTSGTIEITFPTYWDSSPQLAPIISGQTQCKETTQSVTCTFNSLKFTCSSLTAGNKIIKCTNVQGPHTNKPIGNIILTMDTTTCNNLLVSNFQPYGGSVTFSSNSTTGLYPSTTNLQMIWDNIILPIQFASNPKIEVNLISNAQFFSTIKGYAVAQANIGALESITLSTSTLVKANIPLSIATKDGSFRLYLETIKVMGNTQPIQSYIDFKDSNDVLQYQIQFPSQIVINDVLTASLKLDSTEINIYTKYTFTVTIKNALISAGFVRIALQSTLLSSPLQCYCDGTQQTPIINTDSIDIGGCLTVIGQHTIVISSVLNPISTASTITIPYIETRQNSYPVDRLTNFLYSTPPFTPGQLNIAYQRIGDNKDVVGDLSYFTLTITPKNSIPAQGTLKMEIPSQIQFVNTNTQTCNFNYGCTISSLTNQIIIFKFNSIVPASQSTTIDQITVPMRNPFDISLTGQFKFTTYDAVGNQIDTISTIPGYAVTTPSSFDGVVVIESDQTLKNGQSNKLIFTINTKTPQFYPITLTINVGDLSINNNPICTLDGASLKNCLKTSSNSLDVLIDSITDTLLQPTTLKLSVTSIKCKDTMTQSQDFIFTTKSQYLMSQQTGPTIQNTELGDITDNNLIADPLYYGSLNAVYQFNFKLTNPLSDGSYLIKILFPFTLPKNGYYCKDTSNNQLYCTNSDNIMIISGPFNNNQLNYNVIISGLSTPQNDQSPRTFTIKTYKIIDNQQYLVDGINNGAFIFNVYCPKQNNCRTCTITDTIQCQTCYNYIISKNIYMKNSICVDDCGDGYYQNEQDYKCQQCSTNCLSCSPTNNALLCDVCFDGFKYQDGQCLEQCGDSYYLPTINTGICQKCNSECILCQQNSSYCSKCQPNIPYYDHKCYVNGCDQGYYKTYSNSILICELCPITCTKCLSQQQCTECQQGQYFLSGTCRSDCPDGYFINELECVSCIPGCKSCQNNTECIVCNDTFLLKQTKCVLTCGDSFYVDQNKTSCLQCNSKCATCELLNNDLMCTSCTDKYYFQNFACVDECPSNYYSVNMECFECSSICLTCTQNSYNCTSCEINGQTPTFLDGTTCVSECQNSQYSDITTGKCLSCPTNCKTCKSSTLCTSCNISTTTYYLVEGMCKSECPTDYEPNGLICQYVEPKVIVNLAPTRIVPVPHVLLSSFFIISSFVSKLHRSETYLAGCILAFNSILVWTSWLTLIILISQNYFIQVVFACNFIFNIIHLVLMKNKILSDADYQRWMAASLQNKFTHYLLTLISFITSFPVYKLLMSRYFGFQFFKAKLVDIKGFFYFNCLNGVYIVVIQCPAIIATALIAYDSSLDTQYFISAIDSLIVTFLNILFLIWETQKNDTFFDEFVQNYYLNESKQHYERQEISGFFHHPFEQKSINEQKSEQQIDDTQAVNQLDVTKQKSQEQSCNLNGISIILSDKNSNFFNQSDRSQQFPKNPLNILPSHTVYYCQNAQIENTDQEPPQASPIDSQQTFKNEISQIDDSVEPEENSQLSIFDDHQISPTKQSKALNQVQMADQDILHQENNPAIINQQLSQISSKGLSKSQLPHIVQQQISNRSVHSTDRLKSEKIKTDLSTKQQIIQEVEYRSKTESKKQKTESNPIKTESNPIKTESNHLQIESNHLQIESNHLQIESNQQESSQQLQKAPSELSRQFSESSRQFSCAQISQCSKKSENQGTNEVIQKNNFITQEQQFILRQEDISEPPRIDSSEQQLDHLHFQEEILDQQPNFDTEVEQQIPVIIDDKAIDDQEIFDQPVLFQQVKKQYKMKVEQKQKCKSEIEHKHKNEQKIKQIYDSNESIHTMSDWEENQISPSEFNSLNQRFEDDLEVRMPTHTKTQTKLCAKIKPLDFEIGDENNDQSYGGQALVDFTKNHQVLSKKQQLEKVYLQKFSKTQFKKKNESNQPKDISDAYIDNQIEVEDINF